MKRVIKFRAWIPSLNKMSKPFDLHDILTRYVPDENKYDVFPNESVFIEFTGLHDKNGKEIFEGDIFPSISRDIKFYKLIFENGCFVLYHNYGYWGSLVKFIEAAEKFNFNLEIIGNIYENPELIK